MECGIEQRLHLGFIFVIRIIAFITVKTKCIYNKVHYSYIGSYALISLTSISVMFTPGMFVE